MSHHDEEDFWSSTPAEGHSVCSRCFDDEDIKAFIESAVDSQECDFCGRKGRTRLIAAPLVMVVEFMFPALDREYQRAIEVLGWDSAEGGYQGSHYDTEELLTDVIGLELPNDTDGQMLGILTECFGDQEWCERDPYALREDESLMGSWTDFCELIKHKRRYFFLEHAGKQSQAERECLNPAEFLEFIGNSVGEHGLITEVPAGTLFHRSRQFERGEVLESAYDFGPPKVERAIRSNRMSPAGIVMFYASDDWRTAVAEIDDEPQLGIAVGTFRITRNANILDLTKLPKRLGFFEHQSDSSSVDRNALKFLHEFVGRLATRVEKGLREYIDYVPTQVVTEWFRTSYRDGNVLLDGILYRSAQREGGKSIVLFADRHDLVLSPKEIQEVCVAEHEEDWFVRSCHKNAWIKLVRKKIVRPPR